MTNPALAEIERWLAEGPLQCGLGWSPCTAETLRAVARAILEREAGLRERIDDLHDQRCAEARRTDTAIAENAALKLKLDAMDLKLNIPDSMYSSGRSFAVGQLQPVIEALKAEMVLLREVEREALHEAPNVGGEDYHEALHKIREWRNKENE